jgi:hypothetical protein
MSRLTLALCLLTSAATAQVPTVSYSKPDATFEEPFTSLRGVREMADGRVMVSDLRDKIVQIIDLKTGTTVAVGREGRGPGEWSLPVALLPQPNGQTLLQDLGTMRYLLIGADGKPIRAISPPGPSGGQSQGGISLGSMMIDLRGTDAQGRLYFQGSAMSSGEAGPDSVPILRWDLKERVDTVGWVPITSESRPQITRTGNSMMVVRRGANRAWPSQVQWATASDGRVAMAHPVPYRVHWVGSMGTRVGATVPYTPIKVTDAEKQAYRSAMAQFTPIMITMGGPGAGAGARSNAARRPSEDPEWPETMPPFTGRDAIMVTPEGEAWVRRTGKGAEPVPSYDVFDGAGTLVRQVTLRPRSRVVGFGNGTVYLVRLDEDDLQYLERYRR